MVQYLFSNDANTIMVRKGNFELRLIYEDTKVPFKEHAHTDGKVYAEVEPNVEYYLQIRSHHPKGVVFKYEVDGKDLGHSYHIKRGQHDWFTEGLFNRQEDEEYGSALKFNSLYRRPNHGEDSDTTDNYCNWTGFVTLKAYEYISAGNKYHEKEDFESSWHPDTEAIEKGLNMSKHEKACYSVEGLSKTKKQQDVKKIIRMYKVGNLLESVTLHYCSTVGLIAAKVLTPPTGGPTLLNNTSSDSSLRPSKRQRSDSSDSEGISHVVRSQTIEKICTYDIIELS